MPVTVTGYVPSAAPNALEIETVPGIAALPVTVRGLALHVTGPLDAQAKLIWL